MEHYRPDGTLAQGYWCANCGKPCSWAGHARCEANPELVRQLNRANPPPGHKPHFKLKAK